MIYLKYLRYLLRHKYYVAIQLLCRGYIWRGLVHDISKLRPSEMIPYARYFYGKYPREAVSEIFRLNGLTKEVVKRNFDLAWLYFF